MIALQPVHSKSHLWDTFVGMSARYVAASWPQALEGASVDSFAKSYAKDLDQRLAAGGRHLWLLDHGGQHVGLANVYVERSRPPDSRWPSTTGAHVAEFYIEPSARRRGLGAASFDALCRACRTLDAKWIGAEVDADQPGANAFWNRQDLALQAIPRGTLYWRSLIGYGMSEDIGDLVQPGAPSQIEFQWIRHGQIQDLGDARVWPQDVDLKLAPRSIMEAQTLGGALQLASRTPLFASPLRRADETAVAMLSAVSDPRVIHCPELQEFFPKELIGLTDAEARQRYGDDYMDRMRSDAHAMFVNSESVDEAVHRAFGILRSIAHLSLPESRRCIVSHGTLFNLIACALEGRPLNELYAQPPPPHLQPMTLMYDCTTDNFSL